MYVSDDVFCLAVGQGGKEGDVTILAFECKEKIECREGGFDEEKKTRRVRQRIQVR